MRPIIMLAVYLTSKVRTETKDIVRTELAIVILAPAPTKDDIKEIRQILKIPSPCTYNSTITVNNVLTLQVALQSKDFNYKPYPDILRQAGKDGNIKFYIVPNVSIKTDVNSICNRFQVNDIIGHGLRFVYTFPEPSTISILFAIDLDPTFHKDVVQLISELTTSQDLNQSFETGVVFTQYLPDVSPQNNSILALNKKAIVMVPLPDETAMWANKAKKSTSNKLNTSSSSVSSSTSKLSAKQTIRDFYKPQTFALESSKSSLTDIT
jgi:hypothetical protein